MGTTRAYQLESWFDGVGPGGQLEKAGWHQRGTYPDRAWAVKRSKQIVKEEKTKTRIVPVNVSSDSVPLAKTHHTGAAVSPDENWKRHRGSFTLQKIAINRQGYDARGQYYGAGDPLYRAAEKEGDHSTEFRAKTRPDAEKKLREWFERGFRHRL